jgi:hypothetical protein
LLLHHAATAGQKQLHSTHSLHLKNTREQSSFIGGYRGRRRHTELRPKELQHGGGEPYTPDLAAEIWGETAYGQDAPYEKTKEKTTPNYSGAVPCPPPADYSGGGDKGEARLSAADSQELELGREGKGEGKGVHTRTDTCCNVYIQSSIYSILFYSIYLLYTKANVRLSNRDTTLTPII